VGDRLSYSGTDVDAATQVSTSFTQEQSVATGPTYSSNQKSLPTVRFITQVTSANGTSVSNADIAQTTADRRIRLVAEDGFSLNRTSFENDNIPIVIASPLGVGLSWSYDAILISSTDNLLQRRLTLNASVVGIEQVTTPAATFRAYRITYQRTCRRGTVVSGTVLGFDFACRINSNNFTNETGNIWVYPNVGIVQQSGTAEFSISEFSLQLARRSNFTVRLNSTNFIYN
jgi:hypothetical protein